MTLIDAPPLTVGAPSGVTRLFAAGASDLRSHLAAFGPLPQASQTLLSELEQSGLDGRGGAGFPTSRKLAAVGTTKAAPVVIANGAEGEPLSAKDATLLERAPHLVIDGLLVAAQLVGARESYLYSGPNQLEYVRRALSERSDADRITLREAPDTFISGEASAVVNSIGGGKAIPTDRAVRLTQSGLRGRPTVVHNVETLAHVALIARFGAEWFRRVGSADEPGTRLLTVSRHGRMRVVEASGAIRIDHALEAAGFDPSDAVAVLVGGYHGAWVPAHAFATPLSRRDLAPFGAAPGAGILMILDRETCPLQNAAQIATYLASQSARQCGPCLNGLPRMAETLTRLAGAHADASTEAEVRRLAALVTGRGSCHHPDGTARFVLSTLTVFASDVDAHLSGRCERGPRS